jgi:hypothetical protein
MKDVKPTSFVITPMGVIMRVDNHRAAVKMATSSQLVMLIPAKPYRGFTA